MGCVFSKQRRARETSPKTQEITEDTEIVSLTELGKAGSCTIKGRNCKKKQHCAMCRRTLNSDGVYCKECKTAVPRKCEKQVSSPSVIDNEQSSQGQKKVSLCVESTEGVMDRVMESRYDFDLIYITERIISVFFLPHLKEHHYHGNLKEVAAMLKSKHQDKFMVINLSEKRHDICRLNPKVEEFGWPDLHAPPLDKICAVCKIMEAWLNSDPCHVVVLHCKGNRGKAGVIVAAYMHYSKISAGADQALTTVAMRKFCEDKISPALQPSQNRYIYYFSGLLTGTIKINSSPLLLQQVHIPALNDYQPEGGYSSFIKIYQCLKLVYTSGLYNIEGSRNKILCISIEPALLMKGDIMIKCYHCHAGLHERECVFRVQFHTCTVHGAQLWFGKRELDIACIDKRYPADAKVELVFSSSPEQAKDFQQNDPGGKVDFSGTDPVVRWDSYENFNLHYQDSTEDICHTRGPLDGSLYAQVKKRRVPVSSSNSCKTEMDPSTPSPTTTSTSQPFQPVSPSSDSGHSSTPSELLEEPPLPPPHTETEDKKRALERQSEKHRDRETAILDDGDCPALKLDSPCCGRPYSHPQTYCVPDLPSTHPQKLHPKHHTLPCSLTSSPLPVRDVCLCQSDLLWDRGRCPHHTCPQQSRGLYVYPSQDIRTHSSRLHTTPYSHAHTLPAQTRLFCSGEAYPLFHYSAHSHGLTHIPPSLPSHHSVPSSPYRELHYSSSPPTSCTCRDCSHLREDLSLQSFRISQLESVPWSREAGFGCRREGPVHWARDRAMESHWDKAQGPEFWRHRTAVPPMMSSYGHEHCHSVSKQDFVLDYRSDPPSSSYPSPHSSGYHSPHPPCPYSPPQVRESPGYSSMGHSPNTSPPALTPSTKRASVETLSYSHSPKAPLGEHSLQHNHTETQTPQGGLAKVHIDNLSLQADNCVGHPLEQETAQGQATRGEHIPRHASTEGSVPQDCDTKDSAVMASTYSTSISSEPCPNSDPPSTPLRAESPVPVVEIKETTPAQSPSISGQEMEQKKEVFLRPILKSSSTSPRPSTCPSERSSCSELPLLGNCVEGQRLTPLTDGGSFNEEGSSSDLRAPSPVPDGYVTPSFPLASPSYPLLTVPHVPYTGYTAITIPASTPQPPLPEKQNAPSLQVPSSSTASVLTNTGLSTASPQLQVSPSPMSKELPSLIKHKAVPPKGLEEPESRVSSKFVQDSSKFWYKPGISRDQAIAVLKDKEPGCFLIRDSKSFQGAYGLALKVAIPPSHAINHGNNYNTQEQLVRHFLIESGPKGVKIKGCQNEAYFGSLSALVYQHSIIPVSLPCTLRIPDKDIVGELQELHNGTNTSTAADLLKQGAACNVLYLNSVDTESLTGPQAISRAIKCTLTQDPCPSATVVHFKVSTQGITLTDNQRRLFFRRHYPIHSVTFSSLDPQDQRWTNAENSSKKMFGFVARRSGSGMGNVCHLFAELDPEQPATAIVNFINKVMLGPQQLLLRK